MKFIWDPDVMSTPNFIFTLIVIIFITIVVGFVFFKVVKRKTAYIATGVSFVFFYLGFFFVSYPVMVLSTALIVTTMVSTFVTNLGDLRKFLANPFKKSTVKGNNFKVERLFDRDSMYKEVEKATIALSRSKTGAIMTFERNTSLLDVMKNGVPVNAPVRAELLMTIFYPGTRLHDGAVIIHGNEIVAASVFFTPTTQTYAVKYGSRHRAAIGISEISDAVTVVVSEETGRISLAVNGQLVTCEPTTFLRVFETHMDLSNKPVDKIK